MRSSSPFIPKRLTSSLNLQSQTKQYQTNKSFPYNIQSFNFDIPNSTLRIPNKPSQASFASEAPFKTNP